MGTRTSMGIWAKRVAAGAAGLIAAITVTSTAFAHVEVEATPATAGAANAVVTFNAEAESQTAGVTAVQIVLPAGIGPADVKFKTGPRGWNLVATADGYRVSGPALAKGADAVHAIVVAHLPAERSLAFKATVHYSDGTVDRWIEIPSAANPTPDNPAAILKLAAGPAATTTASTSPSTAPSVSATSTTAAVATAAAVSPSPAAAPADDSSGAWLWWLIGAIAVLAVLVVVAMARRRPEARTAQSDAAGGQ